MSICTLSCAHLEGQPGIWEEDHELQEALQRSIKDQGAQGMIASVHDCAAGGSAGQP